MNPTRCTSFAHGPDWVQHFEEHTASKTIGAKGLLILDGHNSHMTEDFQSCCEDHNIIALCMLAHSSHLLQPLDVGCFGPLKKATSQQMKNLLSCGYNNITKQDFLPEFEEAFAKAFTPANIQGAFRGSGLCPLNPEAVLSKLTLKIRTPSPRLISTSPAWHDKTPYNQQEAKQQMAYTIQKILDRLSSSPQSVIEAINRSHRGQVIKGPQPS